MAKKKEVDHKALLDMIKDGVEQSAIMEKFGFKTSTQLKVAYANALVEQGEAPKIKGTGRKKKSVNTEVGVNAKGYLTISKTIIDSMGINAGERFTASKTNYGISLKRIKEEK